MIRLIYVVIAFLCCKFFLWRLRNETLANGFHFDGQEINKIQGVLKKLCMGKNYSWGEFRLKTEAEEKLTVAIWRIMS